MSGGGDGFSGAVELDVIGTGVEAGTMAPYEVTKGEHVEDEQERAEYRALGDALWSGGGGAVVDVGELWSVGEL